MKKIATTVEESLMLVELGMDPKTADMYWYKDFVNKGGEYELGILKHEYREPLPDMNEFLIPAWSLQPLEDSLPETIYGIGSGTKYDLVLEKIDGKLVIAYKCTDCAEGMEPFSVLDVFERESSIDTAYDAVAWLLAEGYLKFTKKHKRK